MKVLLYTRPRLDGFYHALVEQWVGKSNYASMSDHRGLEPIWLMKYFYQASREKVVQSSKIPLQCSDYAAIIPRCRHLKRLPYVTAVRHINAMWLAIERILDDVRPDVIMGPVMDNYVLDVCDRVARTRNLEYSGLLENMVNGYCRITTRGELRSHREPADSEIELALEMLRQKTYVPKMQLDGMASTGSPSPATIFFKRYLRDRLKSVYFAAKRLTDPENFHYNTVASSEIGLACGSIAHLRFAQYEAQDWQQRVESAKARGSKIIFLPLQFYPEASLDYWGTNLDFAQFERVVFRFLSAASDGHLVVLKEHPSMMTFRHPMFYKRISEMTNVVLAPVHVLSNKILDIADMVVTWTGSVGFEAAIRNLPLVTLGRAYYDTQDTFLALQSLREIDDLAELYLRAVTNHQQTQRGPRELLAEMLKGLLPGYVFTVDFTAERRQAERAELSRLAESVAAYYQAIGTHAHDVDPGTMQCGSPRHDLPPTTRRAA